MTSSGDALSSEIGAGEPSLVVGHNVGFDRSFVREQYYTKHCATKFLDTMSMHIAVAGLTNTQRVLLNASNSADKGFGQKSVREYYSKQRQPSMAWTEESSLNNLHDVHALYCPDEPRLQKETRDVFVKGIMGDVRELYDTLMTYCSTDVVATLKVFKALYGEFNERFAHPVTLAGMLEMSTAYLPINDNWPKYINKSNETSDNLEGKIQESLMKLADDALEYAADEKYKNDPWLWDMDWTEKNVRHMSEFDPDDPNHSVPELSDKRIVIVKRPTWYANLCPIRREFSRKLMPGRPAKISTSMRATPKLMRLTWKGYPLHYHEKYKWGYLVPEAKEPTGYVETELARQEQELQEQTQHDVSTKTGSELSHGLSQFPLNEFNSYCAAAAKSHDAAEHATDADRDSITRLERQLDVAMTTAETCDDEATLILLLREMKEIQRALATTEEKIKRAQLRRDVGSESIVSLSDIPGVAFHRLPHKDGPEKPVGNPLSKDFMSRIEDGTLKSALDVSINDILKYSTIVSYWKKTKKRIEGQMFVMLDDKHLLDVVDVTDESGPGTKNIGAIIPRLVSDLSIHVHRTLCTSDVVCSFLQFNYDTN